MKNDTNATLSGQYAVIEFLEKNCALLSVACAALPQCFSKGAESELPRSGALRPTDDLNGGAAPGFSAAVLPRSRGGLADVDPRAPESSRSTDAQRTAEAALERVYESLDAQLTIVEGEVHRRGYRESHEVVFGFLDAGEKEDTRISLKAGLSYAFVAVCDDDCDDVDLALYDQAGRKVKG